ncbi:MAG: glycoside hydrolase family 78 protein, partial [Planctomycetota bacterium]
VSVCLLACLFFGLVAKPALSSEAISAQRLACEHRANPIGIGEVTPELSWVVASEGRGVVQTQYRVLVASTPALLAEDRGDLWDSEVVASDATTAIQYAGAELQSEQRCYWKVRVWSSDGAESNWSEPASWTMGLLSEDEIVGDWIGYTPSRVRDRRLAPVEGAQWIASEDANPMKAPAGGRLYVRDLEIPAGVSVMKAEVLAAADDKFWLVVNGQIIVHGEPGWTRIKPVEIAPALAEGANELRFRVENGSAGPTGLLAVISIELSNGDEMVVKTDSTWKSVKKPGADWPRRAIKSSEAKRCRIVGDYGCQPWGTAELEELFLPPVPLLRTEFRVSKPVAAATLYVSALGIADAHLNGSRVSEDRFTPGWTEYTKRVYYRAFDVTSKVQQGPNALGAALSDGWYSGYIGWGRNRDHYGRSPSLRMQLNVTYEDGSEEKIVTGPDWRATDGPTHEADFLMGESYDARQVIAGWDSPGFDDSGWSKVETAPVIKATVGPHPGPPVIALEEFTPVSIEEPRPGVYVFDLGQNIAGVIRLSVNESPGTRVRMRFAERLNPDGTIYITNLRGARATNTYTCAGGEEVWTPRFTFHGFQYVEVTGLSSAPDKQTVTGIALSSDTPRAGAFESSDAMLNQLTSNIYWTQRSNFIDIPTDCPQRDERLGWSGDAQVYIGAACLNADVQAFFEKWLVDLIDGQRPDGQFPMVAPVKIAGDDGGPAWADAGVICPWTVYQVYGDERLLRRCYPSMKRFVEFCRARSRDDVLPPKKYHCFGDWLSIGADTPKDVIYTAYYAHSTRLLARAAETLGFDEDAQAYNKLADRIAGAFRKEYVDSDGKVRGDTQCGYVLALAFDLLNEAQQQQAAERLIADIEARGNHLSTGFIGTKDLMLTLAKIGRNDVAYRLIKQESFPSWGFSIAHGATSIWERWDGWTPEKGFQDPGMNSFAHYSFGAVYQWMVENIGGIQNGGDAYKRIVIAPVPGGGLEWANVEYDSIRGKIASRWRNEEGGWRLEVTIPANTTAEICLPATAIGQVTESGNGLASAEGVTNAVVGGDTVTATIGSGSYEFFVAGSAEE